MLIFTIGVFILILVRCKEEGPVTAQPGYPEITSLSFPLTWNINAGDSALVQLNGRHDEGAAALQSAVLEVKNNNGDLVYSAPLFDDGGYKSSSGDVLAGDGVFRNRILPSDITHEKGIYTFLFTLQDIHGRSVTKDSSGILFGLDAPPRVHAFNAPGFLPSASPPVTISAVVSDPDSLNEIESVYIDLLRDERSVLDAPMALTRSSVQNEQATYLLNIDSSFAAGKTGGYSLVLRVSDIFGVVNDSAKITMELENEKGHIVDVALQNQVQRPANSQSYVLVPVTARVTDPQSLNDVDSVYFYSRKPDGQLANNGKPFTMVDNGRAFNVNNPFVEAGDSLAADGVFTLTTLIFNDAQPGVYVFTFFMRDKVGHLSAAVSDSIEVLP